MERLTQHLITLSLAVVATNAAVLGAQGLPASQPSLITIVREDVKPGRAAEHSRIEAGWPAALSRAKAPDYYLALVSMTGPGEAWYITPHQSHAKLAESMKWGEGNAVLSAELERLSRADAEVLNNVRVIHAAARTDLSVGAYPNLALQRFWEISWWRIRPGHEAEFDAAAKAYGAAAKRSAPNVNFRVYEIIAGLPGPTYLLFTSVPSFADFDVAMTDNQKVFAGATADERAIFDKFFREAVINSENERFQLSAEMSYVAAETKAQDPAFWAPKKKARP